MKNLIVIPPLLTENFSEAGCCSCFHVHIFWSPHTRESPSNSVIVLLSVRKCKNLMRSGSLVPWCSQPLVGLVWSPTLFIKSSWYFLLNFIGTMNVIVDIWCTKTSKFVTGNQFSLSECITPLFLNMIDENCFTR